MPRQPMVLRVHFYHDRGQQRQSLSSAVHHVEYMGSVTKDELLVDDVRTSLESAAIHTRYVGEREGSLGYFGTVQARDAQSQIQNAQGGTVWRVILSVGEADAIAMGGALTTKAGWQAAAQKAVPEMLRRLGLNIAQTEWIAAVHRHQRYENNPHIHLLFWERGEPSRLTRKWSQEEIRDIRRVWAKELYGPELATIGRSKDAARQELMATTKQLLDQVRFSHRGASVKQGYQQMLQTQLDALRMALPGQGRLAFAYMPPLVKERVLNIARWMVTEDPQLKAGMAQYTTQAVQFALVHWSPPDGTDWGGPNQAAKRGAAIRDIQSRAEHDMLQRLATPILRAAQGGRAGPHGPPSPPAEERGAGTVGAGALARDLQWAIKKAAWEGRRAAYQLAESQWRRQQSELAKARTMGMDIQL